MVLAKPTLACDVPTLGARICAIGGPGPDSGRNTYEQYVGQLTPLSFRPFSLYLG